jgi:hypothetical protein
MKVLIGICLMAVSLAAQDSTKASPPPAVNQAAKPAANAGIPKDAVETSPGLYRWTDKDGKVWFYRQTPFGLRRWPAEAEEPGKAAGQKSAAAAERITAVEQGDSIRFEESTPFGKRSWVRKKSELDENEKRIWESQRKSAAAPAAKPDARKADQE